MTPAEQARGMSDEQIAEWIAVNVWGWHKSSAGWTWRDDDEDSMAWVLGENLPPQEDYGMDCYDPANNAAQGVALFESEHWPAEFVLSWLPDAEVATVYERKAFTIRPLDVAVWRIKHPHPTLRAITEAVVVAHLEKEQTNAHA